MLPDDKPFFSSGMFLNLVLLAQYIGALNAECNHHYLSDEKIQ